MSIFDEQIQQLSEYAETRRASSAARTLSASEASSDVRVGAGAGASLVLKRDTALELGAPDKVSCAMALYTRDSSLVVDGRITLIGPEVSEIAEPSIPFGQLLIAAGDALAEEDYEPLQEALRLSDFADGYMVRSSSTHLWARVSRDAVGRGFNFATLGAAMLHRVRELAPRVAAAEVLFVSAGAAEVERLLRIVAAAEPSAMELRRRVWRSRGVDLLECAKSGHCGKCDDKQICDRIRSMMGRREGGASGSDSLRTEEE